MSNNKESMKKIKNLILCPCRALASLPAKWPATTAVVSGLILGSMLVASYYAVSVRVYEMAYKVGVTDGRCEMMCAYLNLGYETYTEDPSACWCVTPYGQYYPVPYMKRK